jgi:hypothetical protein
MTNLSVDDRVIRERGTCLAESEMCCAFVLPTFLELS